MPSGTRTTQIQIDDMGGADTRQTRGAISESNSMSAIKSGGDPSRFGGHATSATAYTSNVGMHTQMAGDDHRTTSGVGTGGNALSAMLPAPGSQTPTVAGTEYGANIANYPYSYDQDQKHEVDFAERLYRANHDYQRQSQELYVRSTDIASMAERQDVLYPSTSQTLGLFGGARDFAQALCDMSEIEGQLEMKRRELALRSDFNMCDTYKMFTQLDARKRGVDCDDLFATMVNNLQLTITKDEVFIIFYKLDKDGDGLLSYSEICDCFVPRENEYAVMINSRGGFYGAESDPQKYFEGPTRELMKRFIRGFVECEVSVELVRQRIINKNQIKLDMAFNQLDKEDKGYVTLDDLRAFLKTTNMYPSEKCLRLFYQRLDSNEDNVLSYDEFVTGLSPFQSNQD